ncbi:crotonase/enoyl-CoA hydratase family protein [Pyruvatibacter sp.]|uniref:crotonase/enoyl-CoA hydratase family protein n=1 Tax=Pyruvatibacter sp. TaxID=1981328 RepID=UPI0032ECE304
MTTRTTECFEVSIKDHIAHIRLNRPEKRNAMIRSFWSELPQIVNGIDAEASARVIVLSSTGPHFTSGLDVSAFGGSEIAPGAEGNDADTKRKAKLTAGQAFYQNVLGMQDAFSALENCRIPVLAAIQGGCIGGGVDLTTACDMRYCTQDAFFTIYETKIGMTADVGTFPRIVKILPEGIVRELAYTGRRIHAAEAKEVGLVNRVFADHATMLDGVMEIAREIAANAPLAVAGCKRLINYSRDHTTADALDYIAIWNASMLQTGEIMEAMTANAEKREGDFADLPPKRSMGA